MIAVQNKWNFDYFSFNKSWSSGKICVVCMLNCYEDSHDKYSVENSIKFWKSFLIIEICCFNRNFLIETDVIHLNSPN